MIERSLEYLEHAGAMIRLAAVAVIIVGFVVAAGRYAWSYRKLQSERDFSRFKIELGQALMLGLEILVLADVIETITVKPTYLSLSFLAFLVVVRTVVSWTLCLDVEGRWPWQPETREAADA